MLTLELLFKKVLMICLLCDLNIVKPASYITSTLIDFYPIKNMNFSLSRTLFFIELLVQCSIKLTKLDKVT